MKRFRRSVIVTFIVLISVCVLLAGISAINNVRLPQRSAIIEKLSEADKIRLAETVHLRQTTGDDVWPGWGRADIPAILYNEEYAFLTGYPEPPAGWKKVPAGTQMGIPWEVVPHDSFSGQPYYRQRLQNPDATPQAFTVRVGDRWASSLGTYDWMKISLTQTVRADMPSFLQPIFPYPLFIGQLLGGSDKYISLTSHETFHAYQGMLAPEKFSAAERASAQYEDQYPWEDAFIQAGWQTELELLARALRSSAATQTTELARQFLDARAARRASANLRQELIAYEDQREWLEGLARYAELEIWRQASNEAYTPIPETALLPGFDGYAGFELRWSQELDQIGRMADDRGDGRFYYTGMAQAFLLDRLMPGWKLQAFDEGVWLADLLAIATGR